MTCLIGKLTMVGFFSTKKVFLVNLFKDERKEAINIKIQRQLTMENGRQTNLDYKNDVGRHARQLETLQEVLFVRLVLLLLHSVEL